MNPLELYSIADVADALGVSRSRAQKLARRSDFPEPFAVTHGKHRDVDVRLWHPADVRRFSRDWPRRPGRPRKTAANVR